MKRHPDLVRQILLELEKEPYKGQPIPIKMDDYSNDEIVYHVMLLNEAGLIEAFDLGIGDVSWMPVRLTWSGHEFLDAARDDERWDRAKEAMAGRGDGIVFEVLKELLLDMRRSDLLPRKRR
jgi:hypothetical protein